MKAALGQARLAFLAGEVPVGAVVAKDGVIISRGRNRKESRKNPSRHAEMEALERACKKLQNWRLTGCTLYTTMEPCMMCLGVILESRIERVVYGTEDRRMGFLRYFKEQRPPYAYDVDFTPGVLGDEACRLLKEFFQLRRGG